MKNVYRSDFDCEFGIELLFRLFSCTLFCFLRVKETGNIFINAKCDYRKNSDYTVYIL